MSFGEILSLDHNNDKCTKAINVVMQLLKVWKCYKNGKIGFCKNFCKYPNVESGGGLSS